MGEAMNSRIPPTALSGRSKSRHDEMAKNLGYFSIALGLTEIFTPRALCEAAGLEHRHTLIRAYGLREVATGIAILTSHDPTPWVWGRVAGDVLDIATVLSASRGNKMQEGNTILTLVSLAGVTIVDVACAMGLSAEKGGRKTATADYGSRSGFPQGAQGARGVARDFETPRDMRADIAPFPNRDLNTARPAAVSG